MWEKESEVALEAAARASAVLRRHFSAGVDEESKPGGEPVSLADREADAAVRAVIAGAFPDDALLSEESADDPRRMARSRVWVVDPLDGTLDFLRGSGEFAVHVALCEDGVPVVGVVEEPMARRRCLAVAGQGAWQLREGASPERLHPAGPPGRLRVVTSRFRRSEALERLLSRLGPHERIFCGSSGLKTALLCRGLADLYFAATARMSLWDVCAPHVLAVESGLACTDLFGGELRYDVKDLKVRRGLLVATPAVHARALAALEPVASSFPWFRRGGGGPPPT